MVIGLLYHGFQPISANLPRLSANSELEPHSLKCLLSLHLTPNLTCSYELHFDAHWSFYSTWKCPTMYALLQHIYHVDVDRAPQMTTLCSSFPETERIWGKEKVQKQILCRGIQRERGYRSLIDQRDMRYGLMCPLGNCVF